RLELLGSLIGAESEVRDGLSDARTSVCAQPLMPVVQVVRNASDRYASSLRHVLYPHATDGFTWSQILRRLCALRCHAVQHPRLRRTTPQPMRKPTDSKLESGLAWVTARPQERANVIGPIGATIHLNRWMSTRLMFPISSARRA